jgi:hypothetical protein
MATLNKKTIYEEVVIGGKTITPVQKKNNKKINYNVIFLIFNLSFFVYNIVNIF